MWNEFNWRYVNLLDPSEARYQHGSKLVQSDWSQRPSWGREKQRTDNNVDVAQMTRQLPTRRTAS